MNIKTISWILIAFSLTFFTVSYTPFNKKKSELSFYDGSLGEIRLFAGNFPPRGWAFCNGQLLQISYRDYYYDFGALFTVLGGNTYGGDGRTTFGLPDFRGRIPIGAGKGTGLSNRLIGQIGGSKELLLQAKNIPSRNIEATFPVFEFDQSKYTRSYLTKGNTSIIAVGNPSNGNIPFTANSTLDVEPINNMQPSTSLNYIICISGGIHARSNE